MALSDEKIAELIAKGIADHKKEKSWFMRLGWFYKLVLSMSALILAFSTILSGTSYVLDIINHETIERDNRERNLLYNLVKMDSSIIYKVDINSKSLDTLKQKGVEGSKFYAVGYRAEQKDDGTIVKHYRDWDGTMHPIFPDPHSSTSMFTYWFFVKENGQKEYTYGK